MRHHGTWDAMRHLWHYETLSDTVRQYMWSFETPRHMRHHKYIETLWNIMRHHETPWDTVRHHETPWDTMRHRETLWDTMRHHETPWDIMRHHETSWDIHYIIMRLNAHMVFLQLNVMSRNKGASSCQSPLQQLNVPLLESATIVVLDYSLWSV